MRNLSEVTEKDNYIDNIEYYTIGETSKISGISARSLRFYEEKGLISPIREGCRRFYTQTDLARIRKIIAWKKRGFTLYEILKDIDSGELSKEAIKIQLKYLEQEKKKIDLAIDSLRYDLV